MARLQLVYTGKEPTPKRVKRYVKLLKEESKVGMRAFDIAADIIRHVFAKEYGWTHEESNKMSMSAIGKTLVLLEEDKALERKRRMSQ